MTTRWNGWGDEGVTATVPGHALELLERLMGRGQPATDATLTAVATGLPEPRVRADHGLSTDPEDRIRHARGQSLGDWIALRSGRLGAVPDGIARPTTADEVRDVFDRAGAGGWTLIPYGGGTSVVGGVTPCASDRPVISVDLGGLAGLTALDDVSGLASFGAGTTGPAIEAALGGQGRTLGHLPQSFEGSTLGGWVATRSSGQESMGYGRIEGLFAGGHVETPIGPLDLPVFPASAAGPDLRELVLGSEGRLGIITDVTVRTARRREVDILRAYSVPDWDRALALGRAIAQAGLRLTMVRVSTPMESATTLAMASDERGRRLVQRYLAWRRQGPEVCLVLVGMAGSRGVVRATEGEIVRLVKRERGVGIPGLGSAWRKERFAAPYLRNALWDAGYAVDTLETAADWTRIPAIASALGPVLRRGLEADGERVHAFSHLSHLYPTGSSLYVTYLFRLDADPDVNLDRWRRLKTAATEVIVDGGGTISHQHGVGRDHAAYLASEKGPLGMAAITALVDRFDPAGTMHRGVLLQDGGT